MNIYDGDGQIRPDPSLGLRTNDSSNTYVSVDATIEDDRDIFTDAADGPVFAEYTVQAVAGDTGTILDTTGSAIHGIGYEGELTQNSTTGTIEVTLEGADSVAESWYVQYTLRNETGTLLTKEVSNELGQDEFSVTVDAESLSSGTYTHAIEIFESESAPQGDRLIGVIGPDSGPHNLTITSDSSDTETPTSTPSPTPTPTPTPAPQQPSPQCTQDVPFMYQGGDAGSPTFCSVLGGAQADGNLRVFVADGLIATQRYSGGGWQNQFYTYSGAVISIDGDRVSLGYYNSRPDPTGDFWGTLSRYEHPDSQSLSADGDTVTTVWTVNDIRIEQEVTLPSTDSQFYRLDWNITNQGDSSVDDIHFLRGEDTYLAGGDFGNGFWNENTSTVGVRKTVGGVQQRLSYQGITDPTGYRSASYDTVIRDVESGSLENSVTSSYHDNGYALAWQRDSLPQGESWTIRSVEGFVRSSLSVTDGQTQTLEGDTETFTFDVSNVGQTTRTIDFSVDCPDGVTCSVPTGETLDPGASTQVEVTAEVPEEYEPGTYEIALTANAAGVRPAQDVGQLEIQGPNFQVTGVAAPTSVSADSPLTYTAEITNTGGANATQSVEATFAGETVASRTITLNDSESRTLAFTTKTDTPGSFGVTVSTEDDSRERIVDVVGQEFTSAQSTGDPHITTFDGLSYDFMAAGDYVLAREPQGDLLVVARQAPIGDSVSNNNATATRVGDSRVVITADSTPPVSIDGTPVQIDTGENVMIDGGAGMVTRQGSTITVYYAGDDGEVTTSDEHLTANIIGDRIDISLSLHPNREAAVEGIFGNIDGERGNDIALDNGTALEQPLNSDVLYGSFRDDWRATGQENLFASDYYVENFPRSIVTVEDFSESEREQAAALLEDTPLTPGTPQYRDALLDVALTGDTSYIASARRVDRENVTEPTETASGFTIDNVRGPTRISQGKQFFVSATITNPSSNNTTETVSLAVDTNGDGELEDVAQRSITLAAGTNTTVGFTASPSLQPGTTRYAIRTESATSERQLEVVGEEFATAVSTGDPHLVTFDGVAYDFMAAGEYVLVREPEGSLEIQARQVPVDGSDSVTINTAVATTLDGHTVVIDARDSTPVQIDGTPTTVGDGETISVGNGSIQRSGSTYTVVYPGTDGTAGPSDEHLTVDRFGDRLDIKVSLDPDRTETVTGLLGNIDGNSSNDIALANGTALSASPSTDVLYGSYRDDWRVSADTTLFTYEGDNGPGTYYDPNVPRTAVTLDTLDPETRAEAETLAQEAGLTPGTVAYRNAIIDYALTGDESYFSSAQQQNTSADIDRIVTPETPPELNGTHRLTVTATNASGAIVPGAEIILYNDSFSVVDSRLANESGVVEWSTLVTGEYNLELYGPEGAFWGGAPVTVDADGVSTTVQRTAPRLSAITLDGDENGEGGYYGGRPITISPEVRNEGPEREVRVQIKVDTDGDDTADQHVTRGGGGTPISSGELGYYGYEFDPSTNGSKQVKVVAETYVNGNWTVTDHTGWIMDFYVESNIIGYRPQTGEYNNQTTNSTPQIFPSSSAMFPGGVRPDDFSLVGLFGDDQSVNISKTNGTTQGYPWSAVGSIAFRDGADSDSKYRPWCSGAVIEGRHVVTAAHCVRDEGSWLAMFNDTDSRYSVFAPGKSLSDSPFDTYNITYVQIYDRYYETDNRSYDIAVLTLNQSVAQQTGTFGYESNPASSYKYRSDALHLTGYPSDDFADYVQNDFEMWELRVSGEDTTVDIDILPTVDSGCRQNLCHDFETGADIGELNTHGMSGGPIWRANGAQPIIISTNQGAAGYIDTDSIGVRISENKYDDIGQMIEQGHREVGEPDATLPPGTPLPPIDGEAASATGDPHLTTYDGVAYDFQAAGEFVLTNDSDGSPHVQARLRPMAGRDVSVISAVATEINGTSITIDARDQQTLTVDGTAQSLETGESLPVEDGEIFRTPDRYVVVYPGADNDVDDGDSRLEVTVVDNRLDVVVKPNRTAVDSMRGLLGSPDGNASNDIALADGTSLSTSPSFEALYGQFRDDYRVTAENSLFDYDDGESAAVFYDADYPSERVTVDDLPDDDRREAIDAALDAGLEPGTASFRDAVIDYALTGDQSYIESASRAARQTDVTVDATPSETPLTAPDLIVDAAQLATEEQPLTVSVTASHPAPDDATVVISNGTDIVFEEDVSGAFESEQTVSWDTTVNGESVDDGVYTLGVVATSENGVRNVTTRGVLVDNTAPSVTLETTDTDLNASVDDATITFSYNDTVSGVDPASVSVLEDGTDVTGSAQLNASSASYELTGLEPGENRTVEVRVADEAGQTANRTVTISVATAGGDDGADGGTGGGGGGGGGGGAATDDFPLIDVDPVVVEETNIGEQTAEFEDTETVSRVTFDENTLGSVTVSEFDGLSDSTVQTITERIAGDVTDIDSASEIDLVTVVDISSGSLASDQTSATVEMEVPTEQLDDPENAVIVHRTATGWTIQETTVQDVSGGTVTLTAPVDSFSLFAVVERSPSQVTTPTSTPAQVTADGTPKPESEPTPADETQTPEPPEAVESPQPTSTATEPGGFSAPLLVIVLVLLGGIIAAVAILRRRDML